MIKHERDKSALPLRWWWCWGTSLWTVEHWCLWWRGPDSQARRWSSLALLFYPSSIFSARRCRHVCSPQPSGWTHPQQRCSRWSMRRYYHLICGTFSRRRWARTFSFPFAPPGSSPSPRAASRTRWCSLVGRSYLSEKFRSFNTSHQWIWYIK